MIRRLLLASWLGVFGALALGGCGKSGDQQGEVSTADTTQYAQDDQTAPESDKKPPTQEIGQTQPPKSTQPKPAQPKPKAPEVKQEVPQPRMVTVPVGTELAVTLETHLRTDSNQVGDRFVTRTTAPLVIDQSTVLPSGSLVRGRLSHVEEPHRTAGKAEMTLEFDEVVGSDGKVYAMTAAPIAMVGEGDKISDEGKVAGGAVIGGIIGALTSKKKGKGALTGAAAGAAAGGAVALATKGKQLDLPVGQVFAVELTAPLSIPAMQVAGR